MHALDLSCAEMLKLYSLDYDEEMHLQICNPANRSQLFECKARAEAWREYLICNISIPALVSRRSHTGNSHTDLGHCYIFAHCALVLTIDNCELCRCLSRGSFLFSSFIYTLATHFLLNLSLCPADQLRDSHVLPVQNVSIQELQAQLEQETRLHREEQEKFTERIIQVNTKPTCWDAAWCVTWALFVRTVGTCVLMAMPVRPHLSEWRIWNLGKPKLKPVVPLWIWLLWLVERNFVLPSAGEITVDTWNTAWRILSPFSSLGKSSIWLPTLFWLLAKRKSSNSLKSEELLRTHSWETNQDNHSCISQYSVLPIFALIAGE